MSINVGYEHKFFDLLYIGRIKVSPFILHRIRIGAIQLLKLLRNDVGLFKKLTACCLGEGFALLNSTADSLPETAATFDACKRRYS